MATDFDPRQAPTSTSETVVHTTAASAANQSVPPRTTHSATHTPPGQTIKTSTTTRPTGFAQTPAAKMPAFSSPHKPESSNLGTYVSIGAIIILVILLVYQVLSKGGMRTQIRTLESEKAELTAQLTALQAEVASLRSSVSQNSNQVAPVATIEEVSPVATTVLNLSPYPVLFRENNYQKIAQTITVTNTAKISGVFLRGTAGKGSAGQVVLYENPDLGKLSDAKVVGKRTFDTSKIPDNQTFAVQFQNPVELKGGVRYLLAIETTKKDAQANIAFRPATPTAPGTMWVYSRKIAESGEVLDANFSWQEIPNSDLFFELRGVE